MLFVKNTLLKIAIKTHKKTPGANNDCKKKKYKLLKTIKKILCSNKKANKSLH